MACSKCNKAKGLITKAAQRDKTAQAAALNPSTTPLFHDHYKDLSVLRDNARRGYRNKEVEATHLNKLMTEVVLRAPENSKIQSLVSDFVMKSSALKDIEFIDQLDALLDELIKVV